MSKRKKYDPDPTITEKCCSSCKVVKPVSEFILNKHCKGGYTNICKVCKMKPDIFARNMVTAAKRRCRDYQKRNNLGDDDPRIGFDIDADWVLKELKNQNYIDKFTGQKFDFTPGKRKDHPYRPSIDRIDNTKGYTKDNCRITSWIHNNAMGPFTNQTNIIYILKRAKYIKDNLYKIPINKGIFDDISKMLLDIQ